jgi:hypothetical protein
MPSLSSILKELKDIPADKLEELYYFVHALNPKTKKSDSLRKKIMSFSGAFSEMSEKEYSEFVKENKRTRKNLFERDVEL